MSDQSKKKKKSGLVTWSVIIAIIIIGLWFGTWFLLKDLTSIDRGSFGDMFGSINALFSGLALAGIIVTILLQRQELELQRQELKDTRQEFETQNETLKLQRFENTFFSLLNLHHQIVDAMDYMYHQPKKVGGFTRQGFDADQEVVVAKGRDVFLRRYKDLRNDLKSKPEDYIKIYLKHYQTAQTDFGHYFRNLYRMVKLVDETDFFYSVKKISSENVFRTKYKYTSIIRSQLSDFELVWIFYNCITPLGEIKFKPLIEKYCFLKNLSDEIIADISHKKLYIETAYSLLRDN